ncbi:hypothetical protein Tco_0309901 [Tanacetum coccineum]
MGGVLSRLISLVRLFDLCFVSVERFENLTYLGFLGLLILVAGSWVMGDGIGLLLGKNTSMINMSVSSLATIVKNTNGSDGAQSKTMNALRGVNMEVGVDGCCNGVIT